MDCCKSRNLVCKLPTNLARKSADGGTREWSKNQKEKKADKGKMMNGYRGTLGSRKEKTESRREKSGSGREKKKITRAARYGKEKTETKVYKDLWVGKPRKTQGSEMWLPRSLRRYRKRKMCCEVYRKKRIITKIIGLQTDL